MALETYALTLSMNDSQAKTGSSTVATTQTIFEDAAFEGQITALKGAVEGVTLGLTIAATRSHKTNYDSSEQGSGGSAQRHSKWLVLGADSSFNVVSVTIPTADPTLEDSATGQMATGATRTALENALEAIWRHPISGLAVNITSITLVGRTGV